MHNQSLNIKPVSVSDYRTLAKHRLPTQIFDYIDGGAYQEKTAQENITAFEKIHLKQRVLRDVSNVSTQCQLFDTTLSMPVIMAPVGLAGTYARRGEVQALKAAQKSNIPFTLSTVSICSIEELRQQVKTPFWFQLYVIKDRSFSLKLLQRAKNAGCKTLVFTVDLPMVSERYRDVRNGLSGKTNLLGSFKRGLDIATHPRWVFDVAIRGKPLTFGNLIDAVPDANSLTDFKGWVDNQFDPSITWGDIKWIRDNWSGNLIIKGILDSDDALNAVKIGADAIVVSNHGGRQLDGTSATLTVLPEITQVVNKQCKIIIDSGIRNGVDIVKAIALGADSCMIGRAWAYALAAQGEQGIVQMLANLKNEIRVAMALTGVTSVSEINQNIIKFSCK